MWGVMEQVGARGGEGPPRRGGRPDRVAGAAAETPSTFGAGPGDLPAGRASAERVRSAGRTLPASRRQPQAGGLGHGMFGEAVGWRGVRGEVRGEHRATEVPRDTHVEEAGWGGAETETHSTHRLWKLARQRVCGGGEG